MIGMSRESESFGASRLNLLYWLCRCTWLGSEEDGWDPNRLFHLGIRVPDEGHGVGTLQCKWWLVGVDKEEGRWEAELDFGVLTHLRHQVLVGKLCCEPLVRFTLRHSQVRDSEEREQSSTLLHPARPTTLEFCACGCVSSSFPASALLPFFYPFPSPSPPFPLPLLESHSTLQCLQKYTVDNKYSGLGSISPHTTGMH